MTVATFDPFDRQRRIPGWRQEQLRRARVAVLGRDWLGTFVVWAFRSMGIGEITWIGRPRPETEGAARFLMERPESGAGGTIIEEPFDVEYGPELAWALAGPFARLPCQHHGRPRARLMLGLSWADRNRIPTLAGRTSGGGWFGTEPSPVAPDEPQDPVIALIVAALLVDAVRERLCHWRAASRTGGVSRFEPIEPIELNAGTSSWSASGGVGVWAAVALAATYGDQLHLRLWDFDLVAPENLNRPALFTEDDALAQSPKADAALRSLARIFPRSGSSRRSAASDRNDAARLEGSLPRPTAILSAVDNAATRLVLQQLGRELGLPVIQGGTATFAADCFTQTVGGPLLDEQMHGATSTAAAARARKTGAWRLRRRRELYRPRDDGGGIHGVPAEPTGTERQPATVALAHGRPSP